MQVLHLADAWPEFLRTSTASVPHHHRTCVVHVVNSKNNWAFTVPGGLNRVPVSQKQFLQWGRGNGVCLILQLCVYMQSRSDAYRGCIQTEYLAFMYVCVCVGLTIFYATGRWDWQEFQFAPHVPIVRLEQNNIIISRPAGIHHICYLIYSLYAACGVLLPEREDNQPSRHKDYN